MSYPTLEHLPPQLLNQAGWPWTVESPQLPSTMPDGRPWPRISIVTPSYNQGQFIEETIRSVLLQCYPNLEYIIMDGGSTDNSVEIIKKYEKYLTYWVSRPDRGQAHAINEGLKIASGKWFNWLNSDDILLPRSLMTLAEIANVASDAEWIAGGSLFMSEKGAYVDVNIPWRTDPTLIGLDMLSFPQDATFVKTEFVKKSGIMLREDLHNVFDTVFHIELFQIGRPVLTNAIFSAMRLHPQQKTANVTRRTHEGSIAIEPLRRKWPLFNRLLLRLLRTRFNKLGTSLLRLAVWYGLTPSSRKWRAVAFMPGDFTWRVTSARQLIW